MFPLEMAFIEEVYVCLCVLPCKLRRGRLLVLGISEKRVRERMAETMKNELSHPHWWWLDSHSNTRRSPWLESTLIELNEKTKAMLKLIEEDADSFAQRAEMYYKKRPELVSMVQDFYRTQRSLVERYDQVSCTRVSKTVGPPFSSSKYHQSEKLMSFADNSYDSYSENYDAEESAESEVDDPEQEEEEGTKFDTCAKDEDVRFATANDEAMRLRKEIERLNEENKAHKDQNKQKHCKVCDEVMMLREEIEQLRKENRVQKDELEQKDQEKIEVIRHLSLAIDVLKQENVKMRSFICGDSSKKWKNPFEFNKLVGTISLKLFNGITRNQPSIIPL
ncbi:hypothetical protein RJT34_22726 [Clitoria ternatea]|uniref:NAB domain-containing protein n=1 Tax=Clitoria ternatea TaxID=43366 RepID=A0AAN9FMT6_CLITE